MSDYYTYHTIPVSMRGQPATMVGKPGVWSWNEINTGTAALIDVMDVQPEDTVLDLGCGTGAIGLAAARLASQEQVTLTDVNLVAFRCARRTLKANRITKTQVRLADGTDAVERYDVVLSHLPRGRAVIQALIQQAAAALKPGGRLYLVAPKRAGIKGAVAYAARLLGRAGVVRYKGGYHVALGLKERPVPPPVQESSSLEIQLDGVPTLLVSRPGAFAWGRVDDGTAALVRAMEIQPDETLLDLGCGTGLLALAAARRGAHVTAVDADLRAIESARLTLQANAIAGEVHLSDCAQAVLDRRFDVVLCNPPFHQGVGVEYDVAHQMVRDAATVLRPGGRLYLVSNAFIRYEHEMANRFAAVQEVLNDRRYRVLKAMR